MSGPARCHWCGLPTRYRCHACNTRVCHRCGEEPCCNAPNVERVTPEALAMEVDRLRAAYPTALIADVPRCPCGAPAVVPGHCRDCWAGELATARRERLIGRVAAANGGGR